jgi:putative ABC transport system permease protein
MTLLWRKVAGDLAAYRGQLALVVLVLVLGISGVVAALNAQAVLRREIAASYESARSPDIALWFERVDTAGVAAVAAMEGVAAADARRVINSRVAARDGTWLPMRLTIRAEPGGGAVGIAHRHAPGSGSANALFIEQSGAALVDAAAGTLSVRKRNGETTPLAFGGYLHDTAVAPSFQDRMIYAFATPAVAALLDHESELDQLIVKMEYRDSATGAARLGNRLADALAASGQPRPVRVEVLPSAHPHAPLMNAMLRILAVLTAIAFTCSAALAGYLMAALMRREVKVVGVMKTLGASGWRVAAQYCALALPLVAAALAIAVPLGVALGRALTRYQQEVLNIDVASLAVSPALLGQELALAIAIPLFALAAPIVRAARMKPLAAIHDAGIAPPRLAARLAARVLAVPGRVAATLALRNVFRRPWRMLVMLLALGAGGALLLTTLTNYASLMGAVDRSLAQEGHDVEVFLQRPGPAEELEAIARTVPDVAVAEAWRRAAVSLPEALAAPALRGLPDRMRFTLVGFPEGSRLFTLRVVEGRAPAPGADEVVASRALTDAYPGLALGSTVEVSFRERKAAVRLVGFVEQIGTPAMYAPFATFDAVTALEAGATALRAKARAGTPDALAAALDQAFLDARRAPAQVISRTLVRDALDEHFAVVGGVMRIVALAASLAGALVLVATAAFNVLERTREVGVLRALGATRERIVAIFALEGIAVALAATALAVGTSVALSVAILAAAERSLLRVAVPMQFSYPGLGLLAAGALLVIAAIWVLVAWALRKPPRDALAAD